MKKKNLMLLILALIMTLSAPAASLTAFFASPAITAEAAGTTGFVKEGDFYAYEKNGKKVKGWQKIDGKTYYFDKHYHRVTGWRYLKRNGKANYYWFDKKGVLDGKGGGIKESKAIYKKAKATAMTTKYLVMVDRSHHMIAIYEKREGALHCVKYFSCSTGREGYATSRGTFYTGNYTRTYINFGTRRAFYPVSILRSSGYFHSTPYSQRFGYPVASEKIDEKLGEDISKGCIRVALANAYWMFWNIRGGQKVIIW